MLRDDRIFKPAGEGKLEDDCYGVAGGGGQGEGIVGVVAEDGVGSA